MIIVVFSESWPSWWWRLMTEDVLFTLLFLWYLIFSNKCVFPQKSRKRHILIKKNKNKSNILRFVYSRKFGKLEVTEKKIEILIKLGRYDIKITRIQGNRVIHLLVFQGHTLASKTISSYKIRNNLILPYNHGARLKFCSQIILLSLWMNKDIKSV